MVRQPKSAPENYKRVTTREDEREQQQVMEYIEFHQVVSLEKITNTLRQRYLTEMKQIF